MLNYLDTTLHPNSQEPLFIPKPSLPLYSQDPNQVCLFILNPKLTHYSHSQIISLFPNPKSQSTSLFPDQVPRFILRPSLSLYSHAQFPFFIPTPRLSLYSHAQVLLFITRPDRSGTSFQPQEKVLRKFASKISVEKYDGPASLPRHIGTALSEHNKTQATKHVRSR